jgi:hypothetical protein
MKKIIKNKLKHSLFYEGQITIVGCSRPHKDVLKPLLLIISVSLIAFNVVSCKKLAETPIPTDQVAQNSVYTNDATAIAVMNDVYRLMNTAPIQSLGNLGSISVNLGLAADEFSLTSPYKTGTNLFQKYYQNDLSTVSPTLTYGGEHWGPFYKIIFRCNAAIEGLSSSGADVLTPKVKLQLLGEAKFVRSFFYFYLVNEFGDVPLVLTTDPQMNINLARSPKADVYKQMINDLLDAEDKLSSDYLDVTLLSKTSERVRPTKWAAAALLARVYLYNGNFTGDASNYTNAEAKASEVINNTGSYALLPTLNGVFLKNSKEAIWQIQPTDVNFNTREGQILVIPGTGPAFGGTGNPVVLSTQLLGSFEANDKRKAKGNWVDTIIYKSSPAPLKYDTLPYVAKYKIGTSTGVNTIAGLTEYFTVLRLAEQYLIRSEARAQLANFNGSQSDLNLIRNRAGLLSITPNDKTSLLTAILYERQHELFGEWGHRWLDLKRTGNIEAVMTLVTPINTGGSPTWRSYQQLFPIPMDIIQTSPNVRQNGGY